MWHAGYPVRDDAWVTGNSLPRGPHTVVTGGTLHAHVQHSPADYHPAPSNPSLSNPPCSPTLISSPAKRTSLCRPSHEIISPVDQTALQMDGLAASCCVGRFVPLPSAFTRSGRSRPSFLALAASSPSPDGPEFDKWDLMELKFGRMIGEDPKLTRAKIMARKANPDVSYLDVEKEFAKKKGKFEIVEIPLDWSKKEVEPSNPSYDERVRSKSFKSDKGLNLVRPVMKKGIGSGQKSNSALDGLGIETSQSSQKINTKSKSASNVTLRKPSVLHADDVETEKSLKVEIKPNLYLKMRKDLLNKTKDSSGNLSKVSLLKKPEPIGVSSNYNQENMSSADAVGSSSGKVSRESSNVTLSKKLDQIGISTNSNRKNMYSADAVQLSSGKVSMESSNVTLSKKPEPIRIALNSNQEKMSSADAVQSGKVSMESFEPIRISLNSNQENMSSSGAVGLSSVTAGMESSNVTLSKKSELSRISLNSNQESLSSASAVGSTSGNVGMESSKVTLSKKPEAIKTSLNSNKENMPSADAVQLNSARVSLESSNVAQSKKPELISISLNSNQENMPPADAVGLNSVMSSMESVGEEISVPSTILDPDEQKVEIETSQLNIGLQRPTPSNSGSTKMGATINQPVDQNSVQSSGNLSRQAAIQGKPQRLELPAIQGPDPNGAAKMNVNNEIHNDAEEITHFQSAALGEQEEKDWARAEDILQTGKREEMEVISNSCRGFVVSFGSLNRNLVLDSDQIPESVQQLGDKPAADIKFEDLLEAYDQEKTKFLSSFVGQRINACVMLADRNSRRLLFSTRLRENEEITEKKRSLMAKLSIGDVVKCCIKKIKYFGIFVEVEGVPALIHQSEVSWDATLDPSAYFKIGQIVEAKVHQLDFALGRISLSLKEITPDPLVEALESLESVIGDCNSLDGSRGTAQADVEWPDVESLIEELKKIECVDCVSKGRFFLSPGLAPTFQVYMGSVLDNQYKLLARFGNKVQELPSSQYRRLHSGLCHLLMRRVRIDPTPLTAKTRGYKIDQRLNWIFHVVTATHARGERE
ncbi:hypothetical protein ACLOJK_024512 [Asimina triloba]